MNPVPRPEIDARAPWARARRGLTNLAARCDRRSSAATLARAVAIVGAAAAVSAVLLACDADLATAGLVLLGLVVVASAFGPADAALVVICAYLAINLFFTDPSGSFAIDKVEDLVPLAAFALAACACARPNAHLDFRPLGAVALVGIASGLLVATDADLVTAALVLLGVVVLTAVTGVPSAVTAVVACYLALNFWFTPPIGSLEITKIDDLVPLFAFITAAAMSAGTVARIDWLRRRAVIVEQREFEARVAQATSEDRATFLASMTHNLRTPLATIRASIAAVLAAPRDDPARRTALLVNAQHETERLDRLVTKVLQMTRIHAGALDPSLETIELGELAGRAARRLQHLAGEKDVHVVVTSEGIVLALVDPDMLELVVIVMLENALRFAAPHSEIDIVVEATSDDQARLRVSDHGPGIPPEWREAVFGEFVRLDGDGGSSGLGLTIARSIVEAHHGVMWIEETPGGGTTVIVQLAAESTDGQP